MTDCDTSFATHFHAERAWPRADDEATYYPSGTPHLGREGIAYRIYPVTGDPWCAVFAPPDTSRVSGTHHCVAHPDGYTLGVVNSGEGYIVSSRDPTIWTINPVYNISDVRVVDDSRCVVYAGQNDIACYDQSGLRWLKEVSYDGIRALECDAVSVSGEAWDAPLARWRRFSLDARSGYGTFLPR